MKSPTGRLAPSPTGLLHVGHARTFLLAWWHLRAQGGRVLLRLEDLDASRSSAAAAEAIVRDLAWLGIDWDGPVDVQSAARAGHEEALTQLLARGLAYPCTCTRREIRDALSAPHGDQPGEPLYPGTCRDRYASLAEARARSGREPALRLRLPDPPADLTVTIRDELAGNCTQDLRASAGDFPIARNDGAAAYQLAVVVDDDRQGVDVVHRGDDLLDSTPRQAFLQRLLGLPAPRWVHFPLVHDASGHRLAKRHDALALAELRAAGVDPRALVAWIARGAGFAVAAGERLDAAALVPRFALTRVPRSPVCFAGAHALDGPGGTQPQGDPG